MKTPTVFLSRRNLLALLSKLDRQENGEGTACSIIKFQNPLDEHQQSMKEIKVTAISDSVAYGNRIAGAMHLADEQYIREQA